MKYTDLAPGHRISRVIKGGWQLSEGHGQVDTSTSVDDMIAFCDAGITTFDCADIYTGVEEMIGAFRTAYANQRGAEALAQVKVHTKCVPDLEKLATFTRPDLVAGIDTSLKRLKAETLDLVQFHWWDYEVDRHVEVAGWLTDLRAQGKITNIGATNFNTATMMALVDAGIPLVSMQVQYSLLDDRPARAMAEAARKAGIGLLCYGSVSGGLLSERWLGVPEPTGNFENRSLIKYKLIVDEFGGWELFQTLLKALGTVAARHGTDIASVASRVVLDRPGVTAVIVGARNASHIPRNAALTEISLTDVDKAEIAAVTAQANPVPGDVFDVERDRNGRHGSIMKYNLNKTPA
jgi:aryl-alcohol dehydrogenase-like predicted oxidoreductase